MRRRGIQRHNALLDATEALLAEKSNEDVSLAQIAESAGVPLPSVYHFFANRNAAFVALAKRFNEDFYRMGIEPMNPAPKSWQEVIATKQRNAATLQNSRPAALRLFLGAGVSVDVRAADFNGNDAVARSRVKYLEAYFHMPFMPDLETKIAVSMAIKDGIWALSYGRHGCITDEFIDAASEASIAYLRNYLPSCLTPRAPTPDALAAADVLAAERPGAN